MLCKIYKITSNNTNKIYIGSTTKPLHERLKGHIRDYKNFCKFWIERDMNGNPNCCSSRKILSYGDYNIELIDEFTYQTKEDIRLREQFYINLYKDICVNENNAVSNYFYGPQHLKPRNRLECYFCSSCNNRGHDTSWTNCCNNYNTYKGDTRENVLNEIINYTKINPITIFKQRKTI